MFNRWRGLLGTAGPAKPSAPDRYVISTRTTGLGDLLICLGAAWCFARNTRRTLVADWRFSHYSPSLTANLFPYCFELQPDIAGVPFIGDDSVGSMNFPSPRQPAVWNDDRWLRTPFMRPKESFLADRDAAVALVRSGDDVAAPTVVFDGCVNDGLVLTRDSRTFLGALQPLAGLPRKANSFRREQLGEGPLIGLHMRHGNGGVTGHDGYWLSFGDSIERCVRAVRQAREELGERTRVFLCTDNVEVERAVRLRIADVVSRSKHYRAPGEGELHLWQGAAGVRDDAMVDMLLLAQCDALIRYPPGSFFTFYAAVMKPWRNPIPETVYELHQPSVPEDPLSPAVLL